MQTLACTHVLHHTTHTHLQACTSTYIHTYTRRKKHQKDYQSSLWSVWWWGRIYNSRAATGSFPTRNAINFVALDYSPVKDIQLNNYQWVFARVTKRICAEGRASSPKTCCRHNICSRVCACKKSKKNQNAIHKIISYVEVKEEYSWWQLNKFHHHSN